MKMVESIHGTMEPETLPPLPCGGTPTWDYDSGYAYRCSNCLAVVGSLGMPGQCKDLYDQKLERDKILAILTDTNDHDVVLDRGRLDNRW